MGLSLPVRMAGGWGGLLAADRFDGVYLLPAMAGSSPAMTGTLFAAGAV
jgi:hypothetical protein